MPNAPATLQLSNSADLGDRLLQVEGSGLLDAPRTHLKASLDGRTLHLPLLSPSEPYVNPDVLEREELRQRLDVLEARVAMLEQPRWPRVVAWCRRWLQAWRNE